MTIKSVILSGGSGTRLWPASRESYPKQLLPLTGDHSLLQETAARLKGFAAVDVDPRPLVVTNEEYRFIIAEQLRQIGVRSPQIVLEPVGRNTAPALTLAALAAAEEGDPILLVMPADHVITDLAAFQRAIAVGAKAAAEGALVTFGIVPDHPETGYGYIRAGAALEAGEGARALQEFVEKPDRATAERYVASGEYYWNSGIFMMKASVWMRAIGRFNPDMASACSAAIAARSHDADFIRLDAAAFERSPSDSIDYAVMEKLAAAPELGRGVVVPLSAGWSDVGAWDALWAVSAKDADGNAARGEVMFESSRNTLVHACCCWRRCSLPPWRWAPPGQDPRRPWSIRWRPAWPASSPCRPGNCRRPPASTCRPRAAPATRCWPNVPPASPCWRMRTRWPETPSGPGSRWHPTAARRNAWSRPGCTSFSSPSPMR